MHHPRTVALSSRLSYAPGTLRAQRTAYRSRRPVCYADCYRNSKGLRYESTSEIIQQHTGYTSLRKHQTESCGAEAQPWLEERPACTNHTRSTAVYPSKYVKTVQGQLKGAAKGVLEYLAIRTRSYTAVLSPHCGRGTILPVQAYRPYFRLVTSSCVCIQSYL